MKAPKCDIPNCPNDAAFSCWCPRCESEDIDECFHSCREHQFQVEEKHQRIRGRRVAFGSLRKDNWVRR